MVRVRGNGKLVDVGPRSAHIAGLPYAAFAAPEEIVGSAARVRSSPRPAIPTTMSRCARANGDALRHHQHLRRQRARLCQAGLARHGNRGIGAARDGAAGAASRRIGRGYRARASSTSPRDKVIPVVDDLHRRIRARPRPGPAGRRRRRRGRADPVRRRAHAACIQDLAGRRSHLLDRRGAGAGARHGRARHSQSARRRICSGSSARRSRLWSSLAPRRRTSRSRSRSIRRRSACARPRWAHRRCAPRICSRRSARSEARDIAAKSMGLPDARSCALAAATDQMRVFQGESKSASGASSRSGAHPVRAVDREGVIRVQRSHGVVRRCQRGDRARQLRAACGRT